MRLREAPVRIGLENTQLKAAFFFGASLNLALLLFAFLFWTALFACGHKFRANPRRGDYVKTRLFVCVKISEYDLFEKQSPLRGAGLAVVIYSAGLWALTLTLSTNTMTIQCPGCIKSLPGGGLLLSYGQGGSHVLVLWSQLIMLASQGSSAGAHTLWP